MAAVELSVVDVEDAGLARGAGDGKHRAAAGVVDVKGIAVGVATGLEQRRCSHKAL